ncbi:recombinase family protein [Anaerocolumna sp. MB42-C2]|uniref:recombinase family protein n=1 Tax=Anaerocolumna sp. MB42-C2 TaxID=3070997 RepID=UPI0027E20B3B|nr:recombinase family protein [Anaerocolumna sp. MB42-C2]WMJ89442.1 recombinase family protein [Anaerocolumna sp. MB42-C2]
MSRTYGYARVSSNDQSLQRQLDALTAYGLTDRDIITDKASGKSFDRPGYKTLKEQMLHRGDVLVIKELDRLSRDYDGVKLEWHDLQAMGVDTIVLDTPILNTADKSDLEKSLICSIVFELLAYLSDKTRRKIKDSQAEGIRAAKQNNVKFGRPAAVAPPGFDTEVVKWRNGTQTAVKTFTNLNMSKTTFYKLVKTMEV